MAVLTAEKAKKILNNVPDEHHFRLHMGTNIRNLSELAEALEIMADRSFYHHVSETKNDFSNWIKDVVGDEELASKVLKLNSKEAMMKQIKKRIDLLERKHVENQFCQKDFMKCGINDFAVGALIGFIIGVIIAAVF